MRTCEECRPFMDHLLVEHRRLHAMLNLARIAMHGVGGRSDPFSDLVRILRNVREELQQHFAEEEAGGCMEEAVCQCPRLSGEVRRIEAEHPEMLQEIDRLIAQALDGDQTIAARMALQREFDHLCRQLHAHEAAENNVLRQAFGSNVDYDD